MGRGSTIDQEWQEEEGRGMHTEIERQGVWGQLQGPQANHVGQAGMGRSSKLSTEDWQDGEGTCRW